MYLRAVHSTYDLPTLYDFVRTHPLGVLTTTYPLDGHHDIQASHIPWVLDETDLTQGSSDASVRTSVDQPLGTLRGHLARGNPQAKALIQAAHEKAQEEGTFSPESGVNRHPDGAVELGEVLILFSGPIQHYVKPKFYTATKPTSGKVVPTWNYEAVQAYGKITVYPSTTSTIAEDFLAKAISDISHHAERASGFDGQDGKPSEWLVSDAPDNYIGLLKKAIVGVSIEITSIGGKFKMSQESIEADRQGVIDDFRKIGAQDMADSVAKWSANLS